ncbi:MAG: heavy metal sensor histidine kinase, partial [Verrucomicrobiota bacterium]|nr:heavy metal sensor histidine kinase [Verrucomicrobiota bacterium]
ERLTHTGWPRELQPLAAGFDHMLDRLEESFTRLSQFSADLAHELRTPVANIRGESEVALTRSRTPEEYREVIESTLAECERLSGTIDSLLFLARADAAERQITRTRFDGGEALDKIASYYEPMAEERQITIRASGDGELFADPLLIGRAVSNLVDNAMRFTAAGGAIDIALRRKGNVAEIAVKDTGSGIPAEHLPRVFDRLYRVDAARTSGGSGLGLALVKSIAELHGGKATITSQVDRGTTVTLTLPSE